MEGVKVANSSYATNRVSSRYQACLPTPGQEVEDGYGPRQGDAWDASDPTRVSHRVPSYQVIHVQVPRLYGLSTVDEVQNGSQWKDPPRCELTKL